MLQISLHLSAPPLQHPTEIQLASARSPLPVYLTLPRGSGLGGGLLAGQTGAKHFGLKLLTADILC